MTDPGDARDAQAARSYIFVSLADIETLEAQFAKLTEDGWAIPDWLLYMRKAQQAPAPAPVAPLRFASVFCSQCGQDFGPGDHGFSHCNNHKFRIGRR